MIEPPQEGDTCAKCDRKLVDGVPMARFSVDGAADCYVLCEPCYCELITGMLAKRIERCEEAQAPRKTPSERPTDSWERLGRSR